MQNQGTCLSHTLMLWQGDVYNEDILTPILY